MKPTKKKTDDSILLSDWTKQVTDGHNLNIELFGDVCDALKKIACFLKDHEARLELLEERQERTLKILAGKK